MPEFSDYIEGLTAAGTLDGSEIVGLSKSGNARRTTTQDIANLFLSTSRSANLVLAGPTTGGAAAPTFRSLVAADIPSLPYLSTALNSAQILVGNGSNVATGVSMSGEASISNTGAVTLSNAAVIAKVLTGFSSGSGTVAATDSILQAIQKIDGNTNSKWSLASGGTLSAVNTISAAFRLAVNFTGTWTSTTNADYHVQFSPTITADANNRVINAVNIEPTLATGGFTNTVLNAFRVRGRTVIKGLNTTGTDGTFVVTDSADANIFDVRNDGYLSIGNNGSRPSISSASGTTQNKNGSAMIFNADPGSGGFIFTGAFSASTGTSKLIQITNSFTGSSTTTNTIFNVIPTYNATATGATIFIDYNPTVTALGGAHYGIIIRPGAALNGFGQATPTAMIHIGAGTSTRAQLQFDSATILATPVNGVMEYNGTNLFFTRTGATREGILTQSAVTTESVASDTTVTINIGGTTYKLLARA
jgi:hypothetical protein